MSAVVIGVIAWGRDAPLWQVAFVVVVVFALVHAVAVLIDHARRRATASGSIGSESPQTSLEAYENRDKAKIVARAENIGPVSSEVWAPEQARGRSSKRFCVVPLKPYNTERAFFDDPAATFRAEGADDVFLINVSYDVQGYGPKLFNGTFFIQVNAEVQMLDDDGKVANRVHVHTGTTGSNKGTWQHSVNGTSTIFGLLAGNYGLNVLDYVAERTHVDNSPRTYSNMRLLVTRLSG